MQKHPAKTTQVPEFESRQAPLSPGKTLTGHARVMLLALAASALATNPASAGWKLVDEGACEGPIIRLSEGLDPLQENCTPTMAGKGAVCFTEVCMPHCLYFNYPLEQCQHGADMAKRYVCVPE